MSLGHGVLAARVERRRPGLSGGLWIDPAAGRGYVYVLTGMADDPAQFPGRCSAFHAYEEAILARLVDAGR